VNSTTTTSPLVPSPPDLVSWTKPGSGALVFSSTVSGERRRIDVHLVVAAVAGIDCSLHRFVRLDEHRGSASGWAGPGLAIAADTVTFHRGSIMIDDSPLGGARCQFYLPVRADPPAG
jgi:hypothetical protein